MSFIVFVLMAMAAQITTPSTGNSDPVVTVSGCVRGNHLKLPIDSTAAVEYPLRASEYVLEGSKELLRTIRKDHDRHHEEVTGTIAAPVRLVVSSFRHLADHCDER